MRRPLAIIAITFFAFQLVALNLPQQVLLPIAAVFVCVLAFCILKKKIVISVIIGAAVAALCWNYIYIAFEVNPNLKYISTTKSVSAQIKHTSIYSTGYMSADITVERVDGENVRPFSVSVDNMPYGQIGEYIDLTIAFKPLSSTKRAYSYTNSVFIGANYVDGFKTQQKYSVLYYANSVKQYLSGTIRLLMSDKRGVVACAMAFGDKSNLPFEIKESFKSAGLSHLLVVSGMHLAAASGLAYLIINFLIKNRRISAAISIFFIVVFVLVTGITPSSFRAGIMLCITYLGMCFYRSSDSFTSIGLAGLLMCIDNPYICYDIGFLLSFTATIGVLCANMIIKRIGETKYREKKLLFTLTKVAIIPIFATLGTMPILIFFNLGINVLSVVFNIIAIPFLGIITTLTFATVLLYIIPFFAPIALAVSFFNSLIISVLLFITQLSMKIPWSFIYINGTAMTLGVILIYVLIYTYFKFKPKYGVATIALVLVTGCIVYGAINLNLVTILPVSTEQNSSILMSYKNKGVLFNREKTVDTKRINSIMKQHNVSSLELIINLHENAVGLEDISANKIINPHENVLYACSYEPFTDIIVTLKKQEKGIAAFINAQGCIVAMNNGEYNFANADDIDVYFSGISKGIYIKRDYIISPGNAPKWLDAQAVNGGKLVINNGYSYKIDEGILWD